VVAADACAMVRRRLRSAQMKRASGDDERVDPLVGREVGARQMAELRLTRRPSYTTVHPGERYGIFRDAKPSARFGRVILSIDVEDEILVVTRALILVVTRALITSSRP
jgi:hypothetical protein